MTPAEIEADLCDIRQRVRRLSAVSRLYPGRFVEDQDEVLAAIDRLVDQVRNRAARQGQSRRRMPVRETFNLNGRTIMVVRHRPQFALG